MNRLLLLFLVLTSVEMSAAALGQEGGEIYALSLWGPIPVAQQAHRFGDQYLWAQVTQSTFDDSLQVGVTIWKRSGLLQTTVVCKRFDGVRTEDTRVSDGKELQSAGDTCTGAWVFKNFSRIHNNGRIPNKGKLNQDGDDEGGDDKIQVQMSRLSLN